jgi:hypothetical protein
MTVSSSDRSTRMSPARAAFLFLALLAAGVALMLSTAPQKAEAESSGCTGVNGGYTCFYIHGPNGSTLVESFAQARGVAGGTPTICNYKAHFTAEYYGEEYWAGDSDYHQGCFYSFRATRTLDIADAYFMDPTYACGEWWEDGTKLGTACNEIHG